LAGEQVMKFHAFLFLFLFLFVLFYQQEASAYLDPSSGSILIQIILGGIAGFFVLIKIYWRRIRRALGLYKPEIEEESQKQDEPHE
jgi:hypothetical protein